MNSLFVKSNHLFHQFRSVFFIFCCNASAMHLQFTWDKLSRRSDCDEIYRLETFVSPLANFFCSTSRGQCCNLLEEKKSRFFLPQWSSKSLKKLYMLREADTKYGKAEATTKGLERSSLKTEEKNLLLFCVITNKLSSSLFKITIHDNRFFQPPCSENEIIQRRNVGYCFFTRNIFYLFPFIVTSFSTFISNSFYSRIHVLNF